MDSQTSGSRGCEPDYGSGESARDSGYGFFAEGQIVSGISIQTKGPIPFRKFRFRTGPTMARATNTASRHFDW